MPDPLVRATSLAELKVTVPDPGAPGVKTSVPPAPFASVPVTRERSSDPEPGVYAPPEGAPPRSPAAVGWAASLPATTSDTNILVPAGKPEYLARMRIPVSFVPA